MVQLVNNQNVSVQVSYEHQIIEVIWKKHCDSDIFRDSMYQVMRLVNSTGITRWLCNMKLLQYILASDQNWLVKELFPKLNPTEETYSFAHVISLTNLELMSSLRIQEMVQEDPTLQDKLEVEVFISREQALLWLN